MRTNIIEKLILELSIDSRIDDGMFDVDKSDHINILREYLITKSIPIGFINECIRKLTEGKYPDRQAYTSEGYLATFSSPEKMKEAIRAGTHFEQDPTKDREEKPKKKEGPKDYDKPKGEEEEEEGAEGEPVSTGEGGWGELDVKGQRGRPKKSKVGQGEHEDEPVEKKEEPAPPQPHEPWKQTPEDTKKRARALGWKEDDASDWHFEGKLVAITDKDGYVIPVKNEDRAQHTDWPKKDPDPSEK